MVGDSPQPAELQGHQTAGLGQGWPHQAFEDPAGPTSKAPIPLLGTLGRSVSSSCGVRAFLG